MKKIVLIIMAALTMSCAGKVTMEAKPSPQEVAAAATAAKALSALTSFVADLAVSIAAVQTAVLSTTASLAVKDIHMLSDGKASIIKYEYYLNEFSTEPVADVYLMLIRGDQQSIDQWIVGDMVVLKGELYDDVISALVKRDEDTSGDAK